jgi:hypothetical protein
MTTSSCQVKRGFFVLRDCGKTIQFYCSECGRGICEEHRAKGPSSTICVDCEARQPRFATDPDEDIYTYRHQYYQRSDYQPLYGGRNYDSYYDDYDVRSFEPEYDEDDYEEVSSGFGSS